MASNRNIRGIQKIEAAQLTPTEYCLLVITASPQCRPADMKVECIHVQHGPQRLQFPAQLIILMMGFDYDMTTEKELHLIKSRQQVNTAAIQRRTLFGADALQRVWKHAIEVGNTIYIRPPYSSQQPSPACMCGQQYYMPSNNRGTKPDIPSDLISCTLTLHPCIKYKP